MECLNLESAAGEREKFERTFLQDTEICTKTQAKSAKVYHVLQSTAQIRITASYFKRASSSGKDDRLGKCMTNLGVLARSFNLYVAIEDILRQRTADFVEYANFDKACSINML